MYRYVIALDKCLTIGEIAALAAIGNELTGMVSDTKEVKSFPAKIHFKECRRRNDTTVDVAGFVKVFNYKDEEIFSLKFRGKLVRAFDASEKLKVFIFCNPVVDDEH